MNIEGDIIIEDIRLKDFNKKLVNLTFKNISYYISHKKKTKTILNNVSGYVKAGFFQFYFLFYFFKDKF